MADLAMTFLILRGWLCWNRRLLGGLFSIYLSIYQSINQSINQSNQVKSTLSFLSHALLSYPIVSVSTAGTFMTDAFPTPARGTRSCLLGVFAGTGPLGPWATAVAGRGRSELRRQLRLGLPESLHPLRGPLLRFETPRKARRRPKRGEGKLLVRSEARQTEDTLCCQHVHCVYLAR